MSAEITRVVEYLITLRTSFTACCKEDVISS